MFIYAIVPDNDTIYLNFAPLTENRFQKRSFCCSKKRIYLPDLHFFTHEIRLSR